MYWLGLLSALSIVAVACSHSKQEWFPVTKPLPIMALIFVMLWQYQQTVFFLGVVLGLVFGLLGDILLLFDAKKSFFIAGLVSFLIGHVGYAGTFLTADWVLSTPFIVGYAVVCGSYALYMILRLIAKKATELLFPVLAYFAVISVMMIAAFNFDAFHKSQIPLVAIGSGLFVISDNLICWDKFLVKLPARNLLVLGTYYPAQACIIIGALTAFYKSSNFMYEMDPLRHYASLVL